MDNLQQQRGLNYPDTWSKSSIETHERLFDLGLIDQDHIDYVETRLQGWRDWRDYFATTGGVDETKNGDNLKLGA